MSRRLIIVAVAVFALIIAGATAVMAQEPDTNPTPGFGMFGRRADGFGFMQGHNNFGRMGGRGGNFGPMMGGRGAFGPMGSQDALGPMAGRGMWGGAGYGLLPVAAEQLGMTLDELLAELQAGKTVAELAEAQEVDLQTIVDAFLAPWSERLAQAVENERMTQEEADEFLATLETEITTRLSEPWSDWERGPGQGMFGPMGGRGAFGPMGGRGGNFGPMMGGRGMWGGAGSGLLPMAAEQLDMTLDELLAELQAGKTVAELAEAQGVDLQTIVDEFLATLETDITARLSEPWSGWGRGPAFIDEDGDGVCDHQGLFGRGNRAGFVDEDGNGICDHWEIINQDEDAE